MLNERKNIMTSYFYNDTHFHKILLTYYEHPPFLFQNIKTAFKLSFYHL